MLSFVTVGGDTKCSPARDRIAIAMNQEPIHPPTKLRMNFLTNRMLNILSVDQRDRTLNVFVDANHYCPPFPRNFVNSGEKAGVTFRHSVVEISPSFRPILLLFCCRHFWKFRHRFDTFCCRCLFVEAGRLFLIQFWFDFKIIFWYSHSLRASAFRDLACLSRASAFLVSRVGLCFTRKSVVNFVIDLNLNLNSILFLNINWLSWFELFNSTFWVLSILWYLRIWFVILLIEIRRSMYLLKGWKKNIALKG